MRSSSSALPSAVVDTTHDYKALIQAENKRAEQRVKAARSACTYAKVRATRRLVLRERASLRSERCGSVEAGTSFFVPRELHNAGRVPLFSGMGEGMLPLGWVTRNRDGEDLLAAVEEPLGASGTNVPAGIHVDHNPLLARERSAPTPAGSGRLSAPVEAPASAATNDQFLSKLAKLEHGQAGDQDSMHIGTSRLPSAREHARADTKLVPRLRLEALKATAGRRSVGSTAPHAHPHAKRL